MPRVCRKRKLGCVATGTKMQGVLLRMKHPLIGNKNARFTCGTSRDHPQHVWECTATGLIHTLKSLLRAYGNGDKGFLDAKETYQKILQKKSEELRQSDFVHKTKPRLAFIAGYHELVKGYMERLVRDLTPLKSNEKTKLKQILKKTETAQKGITDDGVMDDDVKELEDLRRHALQVIQENKRLKHRKKEPAAEQYVPAHEESEEEDGWVSPSVLDGVPEEEEEEEPPTPPPWTLPQPALPPWISPPQPRPPFQRSELIENAIEPDMLGAMKKEMHGKQIKWGNIFNDPKDPKEMYIENRTDGPDRQVAYAKHPKKFKRQSLPELEKWGEHVLTKLAQVRPDLPEMHIGYMAYIRATSHKPQMYHSDITFGTKTISFTSFCPINIKCPDTEENGSKWIDNNVQVQPMGVNPGDLFFMDGGMLWDQNMLRRGQSEGASGRRQAKKLWQTRPVHCLRRDHGEEEERVP